MKWGICQKKRMPKRIQPRAETVPWAADQPLKGGSAPAMAPISVLQRLERFAGARLFARLPHGIRPNSKGEVFYQHAKRVLSDVAELESAVRQGSGGAQPQAAATRNQQRWSLSPDGEWIWSARSMWYFAEHADHAG